MRSCLLINALLLTVTTIQPGGIAGQARAIQGCDRCPLELEHVGRLGSIDDSVSLTPYSLVVQQTDGTFLVAPTFDRGSFAVFSPEGSYLKSVGRHGQGPGEMRGVRGITLWRDSIFVSTHGFVHVFSPDYEYVRRFPMTAMHRRGYAVTDDGIYLNTVEYRRTSANVVKFDHQGRRTEEAWTSSQARVPGVHYSDLAMLATNGPEVVFAPYASYEIARLSGGRLERFRRDVDWFRPWHGNESGRDGSGDLLARLGGLHVMDGGRVVVILGRQEARRPASHYTDPTHDWSLDTENFIDSHIELVDLDEGRVVGSILRPEKFVGAASPDLLFSITAEASGLFVADLWRIKSEPHNGR